MDMMDGYPHQAPSAYVADYSRNLREHFLKSYGVSDLTIELEDGSFWKVNRFEMHKILSWASNDILCVTPSQWGLYNTYMIYNTTTGDSVGADLFIGPIAFGPKTHWISAIDPWARRIFLEDGSFWDVRGLDSVSNWAPYDTVIIGTGAHEWMGHHDSVLINVNMNHYVYANEGAKVWSR